MSKMGGDSVICSFYILETGFYIPSVIACGESGRKQLFVFWIIPHLQPICQTRAKSDKIAASVNVVRRLGWKWHMPLATEKNCGGVCLNMDRNNKNMINWLKILFLKWMTDGFLVAMEPIKKTEAKFKKKKAFKKAKLCKAAVVTGLFYDSNLEETGWTESRQLSPNRASHEHTHHLIDTAAEKRTNPLNLISITEPLAYDGGGGDLRSLFFLCD